MKNFKRCTCLLLVLVMAFALVACGGESPSDKNSGGVLTVGMDGEPAALDVTSLAGGNGAQFVGWSVYGTLWKYNTQGELIYLLAESYEESDDGLTVTINLRDTGFNNGDKFTADDVLFSFQVSDETMGDRTTAMDLENSYAEDDTTLILKLKYQTPTLIDDIGVISMISKSWTEDYTNDDHIYNEPLYCGPYYLESGWSTGQDMVLLKNEYYYNAENLIYDEVDVSFIAEETTRYLSFEQGEYDICYLGESGNIDKVMNNSDYSLFSAAVQSVTGIVFDTENESSPYSNQNLRLAVMYAVDVDAIIEKIVGDAYIPATSVLPSSNWGYKDETYGYNPELAKEYVQAYLDETGSSAAEITISLGEGNIDENMAEAIQAYCKDVGIAVTIDVMDFGSFFTAMMQNAIYCYITVYSGSTDPGSVLNSWNPDNIFTMFNYPEDIANLIREACFTADTQENRTEKLHQMQDELKEFGKILPLYEGSIYYAIYDTGIDISKSVQADGYLFLDMISMN